VRELASRLPPFGPQSAGEVVTEVDIDGVCYTVTRRRRPPASAALRLTGREQEVARMVAKGYTNKTIAAVLEISSWTVDTHMRRIFRKVGVRSRGAMVARLSSAGVVADDDGTPQWYAAWDRSGVEAAPNDAPGS
jgi:DNA-binding CsgD family transcriptional regulator